ncbi:MAG: hypothetical protein AAF714_00440 [Pseudomonadota bacterium]
MVDWDVDFEHKDNGLRRLHQDRDDLNNEMAGRETGRMRRFLPEDDLSPEGIRRKAAKERFTRLMQLLLDPGYRALHATALGALTEAEQATEAALATLAKQAAEAEAAIEHLERQAARLPDGTRVFRDAAGRARQEDGSIVDPLLAEAIVWRGAEPTWEAFAKARERLESLRRSQDEVMLYQANVLGPTRERITDEDAPPSPEELRRIMDELVRNMPAAVQVEHEAPDVEHKAPTTPTSTIMVPPLKGG